MQRFRFQSSVLPILVLLCLILVTTFGAFFVWQKLQGDSYAVAVHQWEVGNLTHALRLSQAEGLGDSPRGKLLQSRCLRWMGNPQAAKAIVSQFDANPAQLPAIQSEEYLLRILTNEENGNAETLYRTCLKLGIHPLDALHSCVMHFVDRRDPQSVDSLIGLARDQVSEIWIKYFQGLSAQLGNQNDQAIRYHREVITLEPSNELAHLAMAELLLSPLREGDDDLIDLLASATTRFPDNPEFFARYVRASRLEGKLFDIDPWLSTRKLLSPIEANEVAEYFAYVGQYERASQIYETNLGLSQSVLENNIDQSFEWIQSSDRDQTDRGQGVMLLEQANRVAVSKALSGKYEEAHNLFSRAYDRAGRARRIVDLKVKLPFSNDRSKLQAELRSVQDLRITFADSEIDVDWLKQLDAVPTAEGRSLYQAHCAQCHGETGDGMGNASATVYPYPRSFRHEPMRYVSAANKLATDNDLSETIRHGLAGSGMPAYPTLQEHELSQLIKVIRYFQATGLREKYRHSEEADSEEAMLDWIKRRFIPNERVDPPQSLREFNVDEGKTAFGKYGCERCHAPLERADNASIAMFDSRGFEVKPRRFGIEPLRKGNDYSEVYRRIVLGMPGTPHPEIGEIDGQTLANLIAYVRILSNVQRDAAGSNFLRLTQ
jgi:tetratricopeptide (TPR) repeat protein